MPVQLSIPRRVQVATTCVAAVVLAGTSVLVSHVVADRSQAAAAVPAPIIAPRTITIAGTGDILVHPPTWAQAAADASTPDTRFTFEKIFAPIAGQLRSPDLAICHLEAPIGPGAPEDFPRFKAPLELAPAIKWAGWDTCSTASNHSMDQGEAGVYASLDALDAAHLRHTGTFRSKTASLRPTIYTVNGIKIGHLSYSFDFNGLPRPHGKNWIANQIEPAAVLAAAKSARRAGAQIVVLSMHAGVELDHEPGVDQERWAKQFIASPDIDLILGHHAHVVQPFQKINGKWIAYGLGNTLARHDFPIDANREGVIARFTFTQNSAGTFTVTRAEAVPMWLSLKPNIRVVPLAQTITGMATLDTRRHHYQQLLNGIGTVLNQRGAVKDGLIIDGVTHEAKGQVG
jgi:hypothetical protein